MNDYYSDHIRASLRAGYPRRTVSQDPPRIARYQRPQGRTRAFLASWYLGLPASVLCLIAVAVIFWGLR